MQAWKMEQTKHRKMKNRKMGEHMKNEQWKKMTILEKWKHVHGDNVRYQDQSLGQGQGEKDSRYHDRDQTK